MKSGITGAADLGRVNGSEEETLSAGLDYLRRVFRVRDVETHMLVKGPKIKLQLDAIGRLPTGQYALFEAKHAIADRSAWDLTLQMLSRRRDFAEVFGIPEHQVVGVVIASSISERAVRTLADSGVASIATAPEPRILNKGQLIRTIDARDFQIHELLNGNWLVVGMTGSGKTHFLKEFVAQTITTQARIVVVGQQSEYEFESLPAKLLDLRLTSLASNEEVPIEQYDDTLSPAQLQLLKTLVGSGMLSYERLQAEFSEELIRSVKFPSKTQEKVLEFRHDLILDVEQLRHLFGDRSRAIGIDTAGLTRDQARIMLLSTLRLLSSIAVAAGTRVVVVIDPLELFVLDEDPQDPILRRLEGIAREGRKLGISIVLASQTVGPALRAIQANAQGCIAFKLTDDASAREMATCWQIQPDILLDMTRRLSMGNFVAISREGVYA